jgi:hypothetical protein
LELVHVRSLERVAISFLWEHRDVSTDLTVNNLSLPVKDESCPHQIKYTELEISLNVRGDFKEYVCVERGEIKDSEITVLV